MFNSKLTKLAAAVALTVTAGAASAANTLTLSNGTFTDSDATGGVTTVVNAGAKETFATELVTNQTFADNSNLLVYTAVNAGVVTGNILEFNFTNGGIENVAAGYTLGVIAAATDGDTAERIDFSALSATLTAKTTHADGYVTQLQFALGGAIALDDKIILLENTAGTVATAALVPDVIAAEGLAKGDKVTASAQALNTSYVTINNTATTAVDVLEGATGLSTTTLAATTQSVDFANDSVQFTAQQDSSFFKSESNALTVKPAASGVDNNIAIDNGDKVTVTVTGDKCSAVATDDADAITFAGVNMTYGSGCTWTLEETHDGTDTVWDALEAGTAKAIITVNKGTATDAVAIDTSSWTVSVVANLNDGAQTNGDDYTAYNSNALANWSGDVQGGKVTIPYVYTSSSDSSQSYITVGNSNASATKVAMNVSYTDRSDNSVTAFNNYYLGEIAAGSQTTWTAKELVARINAADGAADEGFNTTAQTLDVDALAHMTVELVFQNDTGLDDYEVNAFNRANTARYAVGVSYEGANRSKEK